MTGEAPENWFPSFDISQDPVELGAKFIITGPGSRKRKANGSGWQPKFYWGVPGDKVSKRTHPVEIDGAKKILEWREHAPSDGITYLAAKFERCPGEYVWTNLRKGDRWWAKVFYDDRFYGWRYIVQ